ncbi:hypothetical protein Tco_0843881 [Tanacetum coccineum]
MDDPNITMEEYIRLQEEKALSRGETFNWQTATYDKMEYCKDEDDSFTNLENEYPAIVFDDTSDAALSYMAPLPYLDLRHLWLRYQVEGYDEDRLSMVYTGDDGQALFTSHKWRRLFEIRGLLLGGARRRMTWRQFISALVLHTEEEMTEAGFRAYWSGSERVIPDKGDLKEYWIEISSDEDFLRVAHSYVHIRDPVRRLCHRIIACSIFGRGQGAKKVTNILRGGRVERGIDLHELARLNICLRFGDTWAWVAPGSERQQAAAAGALGAAEDAPAADDGAQAIPAPVQAPQPSPPTP